MSDQSARHCVASERNISPKNKSTGDTKVFIDIVLVGYEKEAVFKTFAREDVVVEIIRIEVAQDTKSDELAISVEGVYSEKSSYGENSFCGCQAVGKERHPYARS